MASELGQRYVSFSLSIRLFIDWWSDLDALSLCTATLRYFARLPPRWIMWLLVLYIGGDIDVSPLVSVSPDDIL